MTSKPDLQLAFEALRAKEPGYTVYFDYYDGDHPLVYSNSRLKEIFAGVEEVFIENWCAVVIDSLKDRVNLAEITAPAGVTEKLDQFVNDNYLKIDSDDVHEGAMVAGESFYIVWPVVVDGSNVVEGYYNDPRSCHIFYEPERPRIKRFAVKWWVGDSNELLYMTLYYPDRLEYYISTKKASEMTSYKSMEELESPAANPFDEVPVFHFKVRNRKIQSDLHDTIPIQNGVNKLLTDMMVAAEFGAFRQRAIISDADILGKLKNAPNEIWSIPASDGTTQATSIWESTPTDLSNYLNAIDNLASAIAIISRTPKHYLLQQGGDPSGEALIAMEGPLTKKATDRIDLFVPVWQDVIRFALKVMGTEIDKNEIVVKFDRPETVQPKTLAEIREINKRAGYPLEATLKDEGMTEDEIANVMTAKDDESTRAQASLGAALLESRRGFNQPPAGEGDNE